MIHPLRVAISYDQEMATLFTLLPDGTTGAVFWRNAQRMN